MSTLFSKRSFPLTAGRFKPLFSLSLSKPDDWSIPARVPNSAVALAAEECLPSAVRMRSSFELCANATEATKHREIMGKRDLRRESIDDRANARLQSYYAWGLPSRLQKTSLCHAGVPKTATRGLILVRQVEVAP